MKKFSIGFIAVLLAIVSFAFTSRDFAEGTNCNDNLFYVLVNGNLTCAQIDQQAEIQTIADADFDATLTNVDFQSIPASSSPYGCNDTQTNACAVGYTADQFEYVPATNSFRVKSSEIARWKCCVKKPLNP